MGKIIFVLLIAATAATAQTPWPVNKEWQSFQTTDNLPALPCKTAFKVGQRVETCELPGVAGTVTEIDGRYLYPIRVYFQGHGLRVYTSDGRACVGCDTVLAPFTKVGFGRTMKND